MAPTVFLKQLEPGPTNVIEPFNVNRPEYGYQQPSDMGGLQERENYVAGSPYSGSQSWGYNPRGSK